MVPRAATLPLQIFSTCPQSSVIDRRQYLAHVAEVARWSERAGCTGILVYTDNGIVDPWLVSQIIIENTTTLCPLVATQPIYMHPYSVAKMITTLGYLHSRRVFLNMVAGGFKNDLEALDDQTPHDRRYDRLVEYTNLIKLLLTSDRGVTFTGEFYKVHQLKLTPPLPPDLFPGLLMSGSSAAGVAAAKQIGATAVKYPEPANTYDKTASDPDLPVGVRVGIIARSTDDAAWAVAIERFPGDRRGQIAHQLAMKVSDSEWHRQLSELGARTAGTRSPYWLHPFENYKTFCPYLVGSYDIVGREIARYAASGHRTFILDIPHSPEELEHIGIAFDHAVAVAES
jgi:alkanesulfonate monooxygenase